MYFSILSRISFPHRNYQMKLKAVNFKFNLSSLSSEDFPLSSPSLNSVTISHIPLKTFTLVPGSIGLKKQNQFYV